MDCYSSGLRLKDVQKKKKKEQEQKQEIKKTGIEQLKEVFKSIDKQASVCHNKAGY